MDIEDIFLELYPQQESKINSYEFTVKYSGKFTAFNANIYYRDAWVKKKIELRLSRSWIQVSDDIKKGLIQYLLLKLFKKKLIPKFQTSFDIDLYESFCKNLSNAAPLTTVDETLLASFQRMNEQFFDNQIELTNLKWGTRSFRKLGSYNYHTDTITMSTILQPRHDLLDFVMFHEMLHKKHKYYTTQTGRNMHHHRAFREEERSYPNFDKIEKELQRYASRWGF